MTALRPFPSGSVSLAAQALVHAGAGARLLMAGEWQSHFLIREECACAGEKIAWSEGSALMLRRGGFPRRFHHQDAPSLLLYTFTPVYIYRHDNLF